LKWPTKVPSMSCSVMPARSRRRLDGLQRELLRVDGVELAERGRTPADDAGMSHVQFLLT
jgi:hypothetical protein